MNQFFFFFSLFEKNIKIGSCVKSLHASAQGMAHTNSLDPDQAQQNVGLDLRSILFDNLILILLK